MPTNNFIESSFWNFDSLFQPQQHPARDAHDTFFIASNYEQQCSFLLLTENTRKSSQYLSKISIFQSKLLRILMHEI